METPFIDRAAHARRRVMDINGKKGADDYLRAARGLPAEIRLIGLGQALATLLSRADPKKRKDDGFFCLYDDIEKWMMGRGIYSPAGAQSPVLLNALIQGGQNKYRLAVAELDAYLAVLKRFAEIFLEKQAAPASGAQGEA